MLIISMLKLKYSEILANFNGLMSNTQKKGVIFGQIIRVICICNNLHNFVTECHQLKRDCKKANLSPFKLDKFFRNALSRYRDLIFHKYSKTSSPNVIKNTLETELFYLSYNK